MTPEEIKAAEEKAKVDAQAVKDAEEAEAKAKADALLAENATIKDLAEKNAKLEEDLENYKQVALKRLGKLPGDAEFLAGEDSPLSVAEQVRVALLEREIAANNKAKEDEVRRLVKENNELRIAVKNRPGSGVGDGGGGSTVEVKDNTFTPEQIAQLKLKAQRLKVDPEKFIERAKENLRKRVS